MVYSNLSKINKACIEHTFSHITLKKIAECKKYANRLNHLKTVSKRFIIITYTGIT